MGGYGIVVRDSISKNNATGANEWKASQGCTKYLLQIHVDSVGATPTVTVKLQGANDIGAAGDAVAVVPKDIDTTTITATGDTYKEITTFPYDHVRLNVTANTNIVVRATVTGTKGG